MVKNLGLIVIAEGVETQEQLDLLRSLKCDIIQGYFFYKPLTANKLSEILLDQQSAKGDYNRVSLS